MRLSVRVYGDDFHLIRIGQRGHNLSAVSHVADGNPGDFGNHLAVLDPDVFEDASRLNGTDLEARDEIRLWSILGTILAWE